MYTVEQVVKEVKKQLYAKLEADSMSLRRFCNQTDINVSVVSSWLNGKRDIRFSTFCDIAIKVGIKVDFTIRKSYDNEGFEVKII